MRSAELPGVTEEHPTRTERLSDEKTGNLLASFGNSEAKAELVIEMPPGEICGSADLQRLINYAQGKHPGWRVDHGTTRHWCERSLAPIGIVAMEITDSQSNKYGYLKTRYGDEVGVPLAGLLLDFSKRHPEVSLYQLSGPTTSSSSDRTDINTQGESVEFRKRAPATRLKIFRELAKRNPPFRVADLLKATGEGVDAVSKNLKTLDDFGLISYDAVKGQKPFVAYKLAASVDDVNYPNQEAQTKGLIQIMYDNRERWLSLSDIVDEFKKSDPNNPKYQNLTKEQYRSLCGQLDGRLSAWKNKGLATVRDFQGRDRSTIYLTDEQRTLIVEFVNLIDRFQSQDSSILQIGRALANSLTAEDKANLMAKANESSPFGRNKSSYEEMRMIFLRLIQENPNLTEETIKKMLREKPFSKRLGNGGIEAILNHMKVDGLVENVVVGRTNMWNLVPKKPA